MNFYHEVLHLVKRSIWDIHRQSSPDCTTIIHQLISLLILQEFLAKNKTIVILQPIIFTRYGPPYHFPLSKYEKTMKWQCFVTANKIADQPHQVLYQKEHP